MNETIEETVGLNSFGVIDCVVFVVTLMISSGIGIYFGFFEGKDSLKSTEDYLMGEKKMKVFPIAISLIASQISGLTIMATPAEMYVFGTQYWLMVPSLTIVVLLINYLYIPIFYNNNISNCYEYLEVRFSKRIKKLVTAIFLVVATLYTSIIMFIPALAFSQVTGINTHLANFAVTSVCIMYTMLGGIKAVVWTDVFQFTVMLTSSFIISWVAVDHVGGFSSVWEIAEAGKRLEFFNMSLDPATRHTVWNTIIGYTCIWSSYVGLNQSCVQRIVALPTIDHAKRAMWLFYIGCVIIITVNCFIGVVMYANYANCDPLKAGVVDKADKMMPYFVQDVVGHLKGISGLFISCVFCAGLSTMSAFSNTLAAVFYYEYIKKFKIFKHTDQNAKMTMRLLVVIIGLFSVAMGIFVAKFKYILQMVTTLGSVTQGAAGGVFLLGMLFPKSNHKGALHGIVASILIMAVIIIGNQIKTFSGEILIKALPTSINGCDEMGINVTQFLSNVTNIPDEITVEEVKFSIFNIGFPWYTAIGVAITLIVGVISSYFNGGPDYTNLHSRLFPPCLHKFLPDEIIKNSIEMKIVEENVLIETKTTTK